MVKGTSILRVRNEKRVLSYLRLHRFSTRQQLVDELGLGKNTISLIIEQFLKQGIVTETGIEQSSVGRPRIEVSLVPNKYQAIGVLIRDASYEILVTDYAGTVLDWEEVNLNARDATLCLQAVAEHCIRIRKKNSGVLGVGIAIPGLVDPDQGYVHSSTHLGWNNVPVADILRQTLGDVPVQVFNRVKAAAFSPVNVVPEEANSTFYLRIDEGVGGAMVMGAEIIQGASGTAGEIGHISVDPKGPLCGCGKRGCLETLVSLPAIVKSVQKKVPDLTIADISFDEIRRGPSPIRQAWKKTMVEVGTYLGYALAGVVNLFNPQYMVIDCSYHNDEDFQISLKDALRMYALSHPLRATSFVFESLKHASALGMAKAVILHFENEVDGHEF